MNEQNLMTIIEKQQKSIDRLSCENVELKIQIATLLVKIDTLSKTIEGFSTGINKGLWILGGGFLTAIVAFVTGGGLLR